MDLTQKTQQVKLMHEALRVLGGTDVWHPREQIFAVAKWAMGHQEALEAAFPHGAVKKLQTGDLTGLRDASTFVRQFLRHGGLCVQQQRKGRYGCMDRHYRVIGS